MNHNRSSLEDNLWITQTLAGDPLAYGRLMNKYKSSLFDLTCRVLKDRSQGEDILQDAFLRAYRSLKTFRYESAFSTWIYAIVMNGLRNHLRRDKIIRWSSLDAPRPGEDETYVTEFPHKEPSIDLMMERKMDIEKVQRLVASFPLRYQSIFILYYFQNMTLPEIAERVDRPIGTVKVYLHRARKMLYKRFQKSVTPLIPSQRHHELIYQEVNV